MKQRKKSTAGWTVLFVLLAVLSLLCTAAIYLRVWERLPASLAAPTGTIAPETLAQTEPPVSTQPVQTIQPEPTQPQVSTLTLVAVGDNLIHNMVYRSGQFSDDNWNYDHLYAQVKDDIQAADLAVINQETMFVSDHANVSSYPLFGTPREIGDAVYEAGFDVILHATNHVMDMGIENIYDAIDYWSDKDVTVLGIHRSEADARTPAIVEKNGIRLGMLNYTYGMNGFQLPEDQTYAVDLLDNEEKLLADIAYCEENADLTVCFLHMGTEYATTPSAAAKEQVLQCVQAGADLLICCHPHVLEPYETVTADNGNQAVVYYSLGNFISAQDQFDRLIGGMAQVTIRKTVSDGRTTVEITDYSMTPLVTHTATGTDYAVYKLDDYTDELAARNLLVHMTTQRIWQRYHEIVGEDG